MRGASRCFVEFFTASIQDPNTRAAYARTVGEFVGWLDQRGVTLSMSSPVIVAASVERCGRTESAPVATQAL